MELSSEQTQTRFLAIVLPALTLSTHLLLSLSFALPSDDPTWALWSLVYNGLAAFASILGLVGAAKLLPKLVSAYTLVHTATLSFVTIALLNTLLNAVLPFDLRFINPVIPSWRLDDTAICRDIDAGFGWDEEWLMQCSKSFEMVQIGVACGGLVLMIAQWWALVTLRGWSNELQDQRSSRDDVEKAPPSAQADYYARVEKSGY